MKTVAEKRLPLDDLLELLPQQPEFDAVRVAVLRVADVDAHSDWSTEARCWAVSTARIGAMLNEAESDLRRRAKRLCDAFALSASALADGGVDEKTQQLIGLGEVAESADQWREASAYYALAERLSQKSHTLILRACALRRLGRTLAAGGDFGRAASNYSLGFAVATTAGDREGELIAATGLGNVASLQGRFAEAEEWYRLALQRSVDGFPREYTQLCVNLSMTYRERHRLEDAAQWMAAAEAMRDYLTSSDLSALHNNRGLLHLALRENDAASAAFLRAIENAPSHSDRAMILDNMARAAIARGAYREAENHAREAERYALANGSPRVLAEVYLRLGSIKRLTSDPNGVMYFQRALDLGKERVFPLLLGDIYAEFAQYRRAQGDEAAAQMLFAEALGLYSGLGATTHLQRVQAEISR